MADYMPRADADLRAWSRNFARRLAENAATLPVTPQQVDDVVRKQAAYDAALTALQNPALRSPLAFARKDETRREMERFLRAIARQVRSHGEVSNDMLQALGLRLRRSRRQYVPPPTHAPFVYVRRIEGRRVTLALRDATSEGRGKPKDVARAQVLLFEVEPPEGMLCGPTGWVGLQPMQIVLTGQTTVTMDLSDSLPPGVTVWIAAAWSNRRGELGPLSRAARVVTSFRPADAADSMAIPAGPAMPRRAAA
jgi:hypothetical protein